MVALFDHNTQKIYKLFINVRTSEVIKSVNTEGPLPKWPIFLYTVTIHVAMEQNFHMMIVCKSYPICQNNYSTIKILYHKVAMPSRK